MSLKNLIALQQKKAGATPNAKPADVAQVNGQPATSDSQAQPSADAPEPDSVSPAGESAPEAPAKVGKRLGLNLVGAGRAVGSTARAAAKNGAAKNRSDAPVHQRDSGTDDSPVFGLADLAGFDASDETAPEKSYSDERFLDEIEATAPERAITADLTPQQMSFIESLDSIYPVLHDPDLFGQAVRVIMLELQENREYKKLICDQDVSTMIRGMRNTMGLAKIRKQEKSRKSGNASNKSSRKKSAVSDDDMALLDQLMGGGSFD